MIIAARHSGEDGRALMVKIWATLNIGSSICGRITLNYNAISVSFHHQLRFDSLHHMRHIIRHLSYMYISGI